MVAVSAGLTSVVTVLHSQQIEATQGAVSYEGQQVSSVLLAGQPDGNPRKLRALIAQPINAPYAQVKVDETVAALQNAGSKDVEAQVTPAQTAAGGVCAEAGVLFWCFHLSQGGENIFLHTTAASGELFQAGAFLAGKSGRGRVQPARFFSSRRILHGDRGTQAANRQGTRRG